MTPSPEPSTSARPVASSRFVESAIPTPQTRS